MDRYSYYYDLLSPRSESGPVVRGKKSVEYGSDLRISGTTCLRFRRRSRRSMFPLPIFGLPLATRCRGGGTENLGPHGRPAVLELPDIARQRRGTPFLRLIRRRLSRLLCHARVARPTSRTGSTIWVGALRLDFPDARQSTALLVLLLPWPGRCLYVS